MDMMTTVYVILFFLVISVNLFYSLQKLTQNFEGINHYCINSAFYIDDMNHSRY